MIAPPSRAATLAIISCGAHMACADGQPQPAERSALLAFLRRHDLLALYGRRTIMGLYDRIAGSSRRAVLCWRDALDELDPLIGTHSATLAATAAAHVALADGITLPQELALLRAIRDRLRIGSSPAVPS
ncbi:MAG TPA: TerB family tellurite resistance protein [Acetobacteraceae bacterium]|nr:TerB family tellurite resistance protein [Acetobacteraceae bacterium]